MGGGGSSKRRGTGSGSGSKCMSPCILVSDYIELDSGNNVDEVHARDNQDVQERRRVGRSSINAHNNVVERCNKREINTDMVMNWFMKYVNKAPSHVFSEGTNVKQHYVNATRPSPPNQSVVRKNSG